MNKLVITADDFGMCKSVNDAIIECIEFGIIRSTNIMTNMDYCDDVKKLIEFRDSISVGLHWNLTVGKPLSKPNLIPNLLDSTGHFIDSKTFRESIFHRKISYSELKSELLEQYRKFLSIYGKPDYWNSHENIHTHPLLFKFFIDLASELDIKVMRSHSRIIVKDRFGNIPQDRFFRKLKDVILKMIYIYANQKGLSMLDGSLSFTNYEDRYFLGDICNNINWSKMKQSAEFYVHPSKEPNSDFFGSITLGRVQEYNLCKNPKLLELLQLNNIEVTNFNFLKED